MEHLGSQEQRRHWISRCLSTVSFSVPVSGNPQGPIKAHTWNPARRPTISIPLLIGDRSSVSTLDKRREVLATLKESKWQGEAHPLPICSSPMIYFFLPKQWTAIFMHLDTYQGWSVQSINRAKSAIFFSLSTPNAARRHICRMLNLPKGQMRSKIPWTPSTYPVCLNSLLSTDP